jgi:hypothetical protein
MRDCASEMTTRLLEPQSFAYQGNSRRIAPPPPALAVVRSSEPRSRGRGGGPSCPQRDNSFRQAGAARQNVRTSCLPIDRPRFTIEVVPPPPPFELRSNVPHDRASLDRTTARAGGRGEEEPVGWVELWRNPSLTSDVSMGFAALYPSCGLSTGCAKLISASLDRSGLIWCFRQSELFRLKPVRRNARRVFALSRVTRRDLLLTLRAGPGPRCAIAHWE